MVDALIRELPDLFMISEEDVGPGTDYIRFHHVVVRGTGTDPCESGAIKHTIYD